MSIATGILGRAFEVLTSSRFYLELSLDGSFDVIDGYFMECSGFQHTQKVIEFTEVTPQRWGKSSAAGSPTGTTGGTGGTPAATAGRIVGYKIPGNTSDSNITLKRGITLSPSMWNWLQAVETGNWSTQRRDGDLVVYDQSAFEQARFRFLGAWPVGYKISDMRANNNEFAVEEVELAIDSFTRVPFDPARSMANYMVDSAVMAGQNAVPR
ncbi:MAG: phage tail protein [Oculatellaceae cyanobacterium Prado106]|jgi:phage tail-like protein|nr:phage tail protein [Oculatellaceae cyanobacterium Prado106]